jgi:5-methylcytosine-specific restriction protein A
MNINKDQLYESFDQVGFQPTETGITRNRNGGTEINSTFTFIKDNPFYIKSSLDYLSLSTQFILGDYSKDLLILFSKSKKEWREAFENIVKNIIDLGGEVDLLINEIQINTAHNILWPSGDWLSMQLSVDSPPIGTSQINLEDMDLTSQVSTWMELILALVISLVDEKKFTSEQLKFLINSDEFDAKPEGERLRVEVNRYERSRKNRLQCIAIHGLDCKVCDLNFEAVYGEIGKSFIHVHHVKPLYLLKENYVLNIKEDLIPLCPNCHSMVHKKTPPYTIQELKKIIDNFV